MNIKNKSLVQIVDMIASAASKKELKAIRADLINSELCESIEAITDLPIRGDLDDIVALWEDTIRATNEWEEDTAEDDDPTSNEEDDDPTSNEEDDDTEEEEEEEEEEDEDDDTAEDDDTEEEDLNGQRNAMLAAIGVCLKLATVKEVWANMDIEPKRPTYKLVAHSGKKWPIYVAACVDCVEEYYPLHVAACVAVEDADEALYTALLNCKSLADVKEVWEGIEDAVRPTYKSALYKEWSAYIEACVTVYEECYTSTSVDDKDSVQKEGAMYISLLEECTNLADVKEVWEDIEEAVRPVYKNALYKGKIGDYIAACVDVIADKYGVVEEPDNSTNAYGHRIGTDAAFVDGLLELGLTQDGLVRRMMRGRKDGTSPSNSTKEGDVRRDLANFKSRLKKNGYRTTVRGGKITLHPTMRADA